MAHIKPISRTKMIENKKFCIVINAEFCFIHHDEDSIVIFTFAVTAL